MNQIQVLDQITIDKIAAGEVIERPASIVKELVENAIDAGATAVTVEIKEGGISFIRITDNGMGIEAEQVPTAFLRHATSKIRKVEDLLDVTSLGFRGEALSSIAAVCQVELITKTSENLTGIRYVIEGGKEKSLDEIGAPNGTTFLVRNIFFNTPARKKFLKTAQTEAGYISDMMERIALSHPEVSFKYMVNNQTKMHTSGNHNLKDIIYNVYGRDIAANLLEVSGENETVKLTGFIGKPVVSRGNRNYENYFVNGRYIRSSVISKAIEDAYSTFMMKHKYPFTALHFTIMGDQLDINVHPTKMELRFADNEQMYRFVYETVRNALTHREMIPKVSVENRQQERQAEKLVEKATAKEAAKVQVPEPFEVKRRETEAARIQPAQPVSEPRLSQAPSKPVSQPIIRETVDYGKKETSDIAFNKLFAGPTSEMVRPQTGSKPAGQLKPIADFTKPQSEPPKQVVHETRPEPQQSAAKLPQSEPVSEKPEQLNLFEEKLLSKENVKEHRIIGQLFDTYWLVEFRDKLFIIDQHAAHEKVLYERTMKSLENREYTSQNLNPPIILSLSMGEEELLKKYMDNFTRVGFEIESFGGKEYALRAVPDNLFGIGKKELFLEMLDSLAGQSENMKADSINERIASMSCKAAVKGNHRMSVAEIHALIDELLTLENPYNCPHGRPTIISMSKYDVERKFKRIV